MFLCVAYTHDNGG